MDKETEDYLAQVFEDDPYYELSVAGALNRIARAAERIATALENFEPDAKL